jgi:phosphonate transport system substrate-binding protein
MFRAPRPLVAVALSAAGLLALAGCGGASSSATTSSSGSATGAAASSSAFGKYDRTGWPSSITMGAIPSENATALAAKLAPLSKLIKDKLGVEVKIFSGTSYSALIEAQKAKKVDLVEYGPFSYYIAQNQGLKLHNVGIVINSAGSTGGYKSYAETVASNASINSLTDFAGKKVCFVDPASTSGYLYPSYGLLQEGIDPTKGITPVFAGAHDASLLAIAKGTCDAGFSYDTVLDTLTQKGQIKQGQIKVVWKSPEIPGSPVSASDYLPATLISALQDVFVNDANASKLAAGGYCGSESDCKTKLGFWGFADPKVADYGVLDQVCAATKSPTCTKLS